MLRLLLYTTEHCSLCERALDLLLSLPEVAGNELLVFDIANDAGLVERYGDSIPVLRCGESELKAPFDAQDVRQFLGRAASG